MTDDLPINGSSSDDANHNIDVHVDVDAIPAGDHDRPNFVNETTTMVGRDDDNNNDSNNRKDGPIVSNNRTANHDDVVVAMASVSHEQKDSTIIISPKESNTQSDTAKGSVNDGPDKKSSPLLSLDGNNDNNDNVNTIIMGTISNTQNIHNDDGPHHNMENNHKGEIEIMCHSGDDVVEEPNQDQLSKDSIDDENPGTGLGNNNNNNNNNNTTAVIINNADTTIMAGGSSSLSSSSIQQQQQLPINRPIKRARTAYFIFADEMRPKIQAKYPGESVATMARKIGQCWSEISPDEKSKYQQQSAEERKIVAAQVEAVYQTTTKGGTLPDIEQNSTINKHNPDGSNSNNNINNNPISDLIFPVARIRKICRLDPEVKNLSKEAVHLVTKCAELATIKLGLEAVKVARLQNRRKLLPEDVAHVCTHRDPFLFLKDDVKDLITSLKEERIMTMTTAVEDTTANNNNSNSNNKMGGGGEQGSRRDTIREAAAAGSKPLTSYFGTVPPAGPK